MAEATWQLRQRPRTLDRRAPDWRGARDEVGRCLWAWSIRLSIHCPAGAGFAPLHGSVDGYRVTPSARVERRAALLLLIEGILSRTATSLCPQRSDRPRVRSNALLGVRCFTDHPTP